MPCCKLWPTTIVKNGNAQSALQRLASTFRAGAPQFDVKVDRIKAETLGITVGQIFQTLSGYVGSNYVTQFNKFGHVFQVYAQGEPTYRASADDIGNLKVKAGNGTMTPLGTMVEVVPARGPSLISLYNLYPTADHHRRRRDRLQLGPGARHHGAGRQPDAAAGNGLRMDGDVLSGKAGRQVRSITSSASRCCWSISCLPGSTRAGSCRFAVLLAVPLALLGTVGALQRARRRQQSLHADRPHPADRARQQKRDPHRRIRARATRRRASTILVAAREAARLRFRPILMTSFAFILGVLPLVLATGAGADARKSIGIAVFSGMIASTCLAVLFVPSFYVALQRIEEWLKRDKAPPQVEAEPTVTRTPV